MDVDHLHRLVTAVLAEGETTNDSGPAHDALMMYLREIVDADLSTATVFGDDACPAWARDSIERYIMHGIPPGDCLRAALANDFLGCAARADPTAGRALAAIAGFIHRHVPGDAHGSVEDVDAWVLRHRAERARQEHLRATQEKI